MKALVGSYTLLNTFDICPHQAYRRYLLKDIPFVKTPEMAHGNSVHAGMETRLKTGKVVYPEYETLAKPLAIAKASAELKFGITAAGEPVDFFASDVWFRGKIDAAVIKGSFGFIADWKTGKVRENPDELELFGLALKIREPALEHVTGVYVWLKEMKIGPVHDLSDFAGTWASLQRRMGAIAEAQRMNHWPKTQGPLCGWCNVIDCEFNTKRGK